MKLKLKYIKLFEAFESKVLANTLKYINKRYRKSFINKLSSICDVIDFPISELKDDYFQYLPFKKALMFPNDIEGKEFNLIKFWFTADGEMIDDFTISSELSEVDNWVVSDSKYGEELRDGDYILLKGDTPARVVIEEDDDGNMSAYAIQSKYDGGCPTNIPHEVWSKYGEYSWSLSNTSTYKTLRKRDENDKKDPYIWNKLGFIESDRIKAADSTEKVQKVLKPANFALVLDLNKVLNSEFKRSSEFRQDRETLKRGSKLDPDYKDESIRMKNIERYVKELSKRIKISDDVTNFNKLLVKIFGNETNCLYFVFHSDFISSMDTLTGLYYELISIEDDIDYSRKIIERIEYQINEIVDRYFRKSVDIRNSIKFVREKGNEDINKLLDEIQEISKIIHSKINKVECIEDFEAISMKMTSIKSKSSDARLGLQELFYRIFDEIYRGNGPACISYYFSSGEKYIKSNKLENFKKIIQRL